MKNFFVLGLIALITASCSSSNKSQSASKSDRLPEKSYDDGYTTHNTRNSTSSTTEVKALGNLTLDNYLRRVPGVNIQGDGPYATITIRGINSINSGWAPLFILNGTPVEGGYSALYSTINPNDIRSVSVLKDPATTGIYGSRGANGVIVISLKRAGEN